MTSTIRPLQKHDAGAWRSMREQLGPDWVMGNIDRMVEQYLSTGTIDHLRHIVLIAEDAQGYTGFAEVSLRPFAEGCETTPVGYLEGWFVEERARRTGVGRALIEAGEAWARKHGCSEFASDAEMDNKLSQTAHEALGFEPVCDIRCYRKRINAQG